MIGRLGMALLTIAACGLRVACLLICEAVVGESGDQGSRREGCCELVAVGLIPVVGVTDGASVSNGFGRESIGLIGAALYASRVSGEGYLFGNGKL